jgi:cell division protein FtsL
MAYYSSHNLAYDLTLFEEPYEEGTSARFRKKSGGDAVTNEGGVSEKQDDNREPVKRRSKAADGGNKKNLSRIVLSVAVSLVVITVIVSIIYGQVQLTELNQRITDAQNELSEKQSIYTQLEMKVDSSVSTTVVEQYAKDKLAMNKANNSQKEFVSLSDGDKAEVTMSEEKNIFERICDAIASLWS